MNSRYTTPDHLQGLMKALSYTEVKSRWKNGGKMAYWLFQKHEPGPGPSLSAEVYKKKTVLRKGNRNNFSILL